MIKFNKFFVFYIILLFIIGFKGQVFLTFLIVIFHETVHYITACFCGYSGYDVEVLPAGAVLKLKNLDDAEPKEDLIISISAPLMNIVLAGVFSILGIFLKSFLEPYLNNIIEINLTIGIFNLIPALPLDGGRVLRDILALKLVYKNAEKIIIICGIVLGTILMFIFIGLYFIGIININLGVISVYIVLMSLKEKERVVYIIMSDIIKKKIKFLKKGYIENRSVSVFYKKDLVTMLSMVDKNKYNIFFVLDDEMKVMDVVYEEEMIETLKNKGNMTIEKFINIKEEEY